MSGLPALLDRLDHPAVTWVTAGIVIIVIVAFVARTVDELWTSRHNRMLAETDALLKLEAAKLEARRYERELAAEAHELQQQRADQQLELLEQALEADAVLQHLSPVVEALEQAAADGNTEAANKLSELREARRFVIESRDEVIEPWLAQRRAKSAELQSRGASEPSDQPRDGAVGGDVEDRT